MNKIITSVVYVLLILISNWSAGKFGPIITPLNAFLFIGADLALRDYLQCRMDRTEMFVVLLIASTATYVLNTAPVMIALASCAAFAVSQIVDYVVFTKSGGSWFSRANKSNVAGAAVDSVVFPTIAFGEILPVIVLSQLICKVLGGILFSFLLSKFIKEEEALDTIKPV